jgi:hypothetical protein
MSWFNQQLFNQLLKGEIWEDLEFLELSEKRFIMDGLLMFRYLPKQI